MLPTQAAPLAPAVGLIGFEVSGKTYGVIGTGKIGIEASCCFWVWLPMVGNSCAAAAQLPALFGLNLLPCSCNFAHATLQFINCGCCCFVCKLCPHLFTSAVHQAAALPGRPHPGARPLPL